MRWEARNASGCEAGATLDTINVHERTLFLDGTKLIAVISEAASAGISLHADKCARRCRANTGYKSRRLRRDLNTCFLLLRSGLKPWPHQRPDAKTGHSGVHHRADDACKCRTAGGPRTSGGGCT